ncbi:hypothetical protein QBC34DRAFT_440928 [Podospora aff. communis PSN243]|uniref:Uncharacterized protein n=1 Tax=Podospora aff. communis PSN243 TaxID=3040156 RepID=A0AAV9GDA9_9PEZI|nr:hypothetical protein QBC34DRAFT_440928 [Podospora aff. communis PSN243]
MAAASGQQARTARMLATNNIIPTSNVTLHPQQTSQQPHAVPQHLLAHTQYPSELPQPVPLLHRPTSPGRRSGTPSLPPHISGMHQQGNPHSGGRLDDHLLSEGQPSPTPQPQPPADMRPSPTPQPAEMQPSPTPQPAEMQGQVQQPAYQDFPHAPWPTQQPSPRLPGHDQEPLHSLQAALPQSDPQIQLYAAHLAQLAQQNQQTKQTQPTQQAQQAQQRSQPTAQPPQKPQPQPAEAPLQHPAPDWTPPIRQKSPNHTLGPAEDPGFPGYLTSFDNYHHADVDKGAQSECDSLVYQNYEAQWAAQHAMQEELKEEMERKKLEGEENKKKREREENKKKREREE